MNGVVLAGGRSSRMGTEKALLPAHEGGRTLLARQAGLLDAVGVGTVFLSLRRDLAPDPAGTQPILHDPSRDGRGPLGGIVAAMRMAPGEHLLVLAVDMPFVEPSFLRAILARATPASGVAPRVSGMWEPLCAVYPPHALARAEALLERQGSPSELLATLSADGRLRAYDIPARNAHFLRSWNVPEDVPASRGCADACTPATPVPDPPGISEPNRQRQMRERVTLTR